MNIYPLTFCAVGAVFSYYGIPALLQIGVPPAFILLLLLPAVFMLAYLYLYKGLQGLCRRQRPCSNYAFICLVFLGAGIVFGIAARRGAQRDALVFPGLAPAKAQAVSGVLTEDPRSGYDAQGMAKLRLEYAYGANGIRTSARGSLQVFFPKEAMPRLKNFGRGCRVYIDGNFLPPKEGKKALAFRATSAHIVQTAGALNRLRTNIRSALLEFFNQPWGGLSVALLLGVRDHLDGSLAKQYTNAGCAYILALSGMHLAIISSVVAFLLKKPLGLKGAALAGSVFIGLYICLVGTGASLYRAALMYVLGAAAVIFALPVRPFLILGISFLLQIAISPASGDSISFILSYLALAGILVFTELINGLLRGYIPQCILAPLSASISAFLATMGVSALFFGELRLMGIVAGLVMVPLTTFFMLGSMAYLVLGLIPFVKTIAAYPLLWLYYALDSISFFAAKPPPLKFPPQPLTLLFSALLPVVVFAVCSIVTRSRERLRVLEAA
ncbi:MAG: ComEC/Rec2 family competence protein [Spirochaetaceae bacterium]|nr:ComEC/Rec2 family competence protein [Spirochaetaceae bacterium]